MTSVIRAIAVLAALAAAAAAYLLGRRRGDRGRLEYEGPTRQGAPPGGGSPDDARLRDRVESELFRDPALPKGDIVIDAVGGVVTLRGQVDPALLEDLPVRVAAVEGVVDVRSLLHAPGTPPGTPA